MDSESCNLSCLACAQVGFKSLAFGISCVGKCSGVDLQVPMTTLLKDTSKELLIITPIFFLAVVAGSAIELYSPSFIHQTLLTDNQILSIVLAATAGVIFPIPRYATYPLALALQTQGAGYGVVFALISGEVVFESIARDLMEIRFFGIKFFSLRAILSLALVIIGGLIVELLLN